MAGWYRRGKTTDHRMSGEKRQRVNGGIADIETILTRTATKQGAPIPSTTMVDAESARGALWEAALRTLSSHGMLNDELWQRILQHWSRVPAQYGRDTVDAFGAALVTLLYLFRGTGMTRGQAETMVVSLCRVVMQNATRASDEDCGLIYDGLWVAQEKRINNAQAVSEAVIPIRMGAGIKVSTTTGSRVAPSSDNGDIGHTTEGDIDEPAPKPTDGAGSQSYAQRAWDWAKEHPGEVAGAVGGALVGGIKGIPGGATGIALGAAQGAAQGAGGGFGLDVVGKQTGILPGEPSPNPQGGQP